MKRLLYLLVLLVLVAVVEAKECPKCGKCMIKDKTGEIVDAELPVVAKFLQIWWCGCGYQEKAEPEILLCKEGRRRERWEQEQRKLDYVVNMSTEILYFDVLKREVEYSIKNAEILDRLIELEQRVKLLMENEGLYEVTVGTIVKYHSPYKLSSIPFWNSGYEYKTLLEIYEEQKEKNK